MAWKLLAALLEDAFSKSFSVGLYFGPPVRMGLLCQLILKEPVHIFVSLRAPALNMSLLSYLVVVATQLNVIMQLFQT